MDIEDVMRMISDMVDVEFEDSAMLKNLKGFINQQAETIESQQVLIADQQKLIRELTVVV